MNIGTIIGQILPTAVGVAVSPLPIVAVVLMLVTPRGKVKGPAFILGWWIGLAVVGAIVIAVSGGVSSGASGAPPKALAAGIVFSAANPKNLLLAVAAAVTVGAAGLSTTDEVITWVVFILIASIGVAAPVVVASAMGDRSREILDNLKNWMAQNNAVIMAVLLLVIGVKLIGDAISGFST
jgi:threonine/homoserine/homoserine lactone efflux protein